MCTPRANERNSATARTAGASSTQLLGQPDWWLTDPSWGSCMSKGESRCPTARPDIEPAKRPPGRTTDQGYCISTGWDEPGAFLARSLVGMSDAPRAGERGNPVAPS